MVGARAAVGHAAADGRAAVRHVRALLVLEERAGARDEDVVGGGKRRAVRVVDPVVGRDRIRAAQPVVAGALGQAGRVVAHRAEGRVEDVDRAAAGRELHVVRVAVRIVVGVGPARRAAARVVVGRGEGVTVRLVAAPGLNRAPEALAVQLRAGEHGPARRQGHPAGPVALADRVARRMGRAQVEAADPVVGLRAAHRHRLDVDRLRGPRRGDRVEPEDPHEERLDRGRDRDVELARVGPAVERILDRGDRHPTPGRVAVLGRLGNRVGVGAGGVPGQVDRSGQRGGIGRSLDAQAVGPVPRHVDDDRDDPDQGNDRAGEDHQHLALLGLRSPAGRDRSRRVDIRIQTHGVISSRWRVTVTSRRGRGSGHDEVDRVPQHIDLPGRRVVAAGDLVFNLPPAGLGLPSRQQSGRAIRRSAVG